jgi:hypothetical protein
MDAAGHERPGFVNLGEADDMFGHAAEYVRRWPGVASRRQEPDIEHPGILAQLRNSMVS